MTLDDVIALSKAGFTVEQINKLAAAPVQQQVQAAAPVQIQTPQQNPVLQETEFDKIMRSLGLLNQSIQSNNILNANQAQPETVDDILASIINPPETNNVQKGDVNNG